MKKLVVLACLGLLGLVAALATSPAADAGCTTVFGVQVCGDDIPDGPAATLCTDEASCNAGEGSPEDPPESTDPEEPEPQPTDPDTTTASSAQPPATQPASTTTETTTTTKSPDPPPTETVTTNTTIVVLPLPPRPECSNTADGKKPEGWRSDPDGRCSAPPPHVGYCDGSGNFQDLEVGQHLTDPHWVAKGPWKDAYIDPTTGSSSCNFPTKAPELPVNRPTTTEAPKPQSPAEPPPKLKPEPKRKPQVGVPIPAPPD